MNWGNVNGTKDYIRTGAGVGGGARRRIFYLMPTTKSLCFLSFIYSVFLNRKFPSPWTRYTFEPIFVIKKQKDIHSQAHDSLSLITLCLWFISGHCKIEREPLPWRINIPVNQRKINVTEEAYTIMVSHHFLNLHCL